METTWKKAKRLLSILLCLCMVLSMVPAMPLTASALSIATDSEQSFYKIGSAQDLMDFAAKVNGGETTANALLTANIDMSGKSWIPIGADGNKPYAGNFDGNGYTISNLNITTLSSSVINTSTFSYAGLIGYMKGGGVQNLTLNGRVDTSYTLSHGNAHIGMLVGQMVDSIIYNCKTQGSVNIKVSSASDSFYSTVFGGMLGVGQHSIVINCGNEATLTITGDGINAAGGLAGHLSAGYDLPLCILNSYNTGSVSAYAMYAGGLVGHLVDDAVNNYCSLTSVSNVNTSGATGVLFGYINNYIYVNEDDANTTAFTPLIKNNYYISGSTAIGMAVDSLDTTGYTTAVSAGDLSGSLANILNGNLGTVEEIIAGHLGYLKESQWSELVDKMHGDDVRAMCWATVNGKPIQSGNGCSYDSNGFCTRCGGCKQPSLSGNVYQIGSVGELFWFARYVNNGNTGANAVLTADINMSGYNWIPMASTGIYHSETNYASKGYEGIFDGDGHTISNLTIQAVSGDPDGTYGLFGTLSGTVKDLQVKNFKFTGAGMDTRVGSVVGQMLDGSLVENCFANVGNINTKVNTTSGVAGGVAGCNYAGTIRGCLQYNYAISAGRGGGITGDNRGDINANDRKGTIENCVTNYGSIENKDRPGKITNSVFGMNDTRLASGEATWILNGNSSAGVWKQTVGSGLPAFSGKTVYQIPLCQDRTMGYSNSNESTQDHTYGNDGVCTFCGTLNPKVVATLSKNGNVVAAYESLNAAVTAVAGCTAEDAAVIKLLKQIDLGNRHQRITGGVFTIDLNGYELSCTSDSYGTLFITKKGTAVTIIDSVGSGKISGEFAGVVIENASLTIDGVTISGIRAVDAYSGSTVTISGSTISGNIYGVGVTQSSTVTIHDSNISGNNYGVYIDNSIATISGSTISGNGYGIYACPDSTVNISVSTISGNYGMSVYSSSVTIGGGSISGNKYDISVGEASVDLVPAENGEGITFPGGIHVYGTTLDKLLGEGAAYWQGDKQLTPANGVQEITGGDVIVSATCKHLVEKICTNNGENHSFYCSICDKIVTEAHSYTNMNCACGAGSPDADASVTIRGNVRYYATLDEAIKAVAKCTAENAAVVKVLKKIELGTGYQEIKSGVFTLDLNGCEISNTNGSWGALYIINSGTDVTVIDSVGTGRISSNDKGIETGFDALVTISGVTIFGDRYGVWADGGNVVTIINSTITSNKCAVTSRNSTTTTISGGSFSGVDYDFSVSTATLKLIPGENGMDTTFPGGISTLRTPLKDILGEGAAYWLGDAMAIVADDAIALTGGDVIIKPACKHENSTVSYANNGDTHSFTYSCCNATVIEDHSYTDMLCICGAVSPDAVVSVSKNGKFVAVYASLDAAVQAVANCTAEDAAVIKLEKNIDLGNSNQYIASGVFTIDLNGCELSGKLMGYGVLDIRNSGTDVTITDSVGTGKISGNGMASTGINISKASLTINGGSIFGKYRGIYAINSTVTISGGSISGSMMDIFCDGATVELVLDENGVGTTFPDGIAVTGTTLGDILGEGTAYWQGDKMIVPAEGATEITGGDLVIKKECKHTGKKVYTNNGDNHNFACADCGNTIAEDHIYTNGVCVCDFVAPDAVASVSKNGKTVAAYTSLDAAIQAVAGCTAKDAAVVKLLQEIELGNNDQTIACGVFTLDLNGYELSSSHAEGGVLYIQNEATNVTIMDSVGNGKLAGGYAGVKVENALLTINGATVSGKYAVNVDDGGIVNIIGGTISGIDYDICVYEGSVKLITDGYGNGTTFPGGITVYGTTLSDILDEDAAYWQDGKQIILADGATEITGGDVTINGPCKHAGEKTYTNNGDDHSYVCAHCGNTFTEVHSYTKLVCACGDVSSEAPVFATIGGKGSYYVTMKAAVDAVADCTSEDAAVIKLMKDIDMGASYLSVYSGVFTIDLNGYELSCTGTDMSAMYISQSAADVTIIDSVGTGKISGNDDAVSVMYGSLTLNGVNIFGKCYGVRADRATVVISDSTISGGNYGVLGLLECAITISGSSITGNSCGVDTTGEVVLNISDSIISGEKGVRVGHLGKTTISGSTISGSSYGVYTDGSALTVSDCTVSSEGCGIHVFYYCDAAISGGSISGNGHDISVAEYATLELILDENGMGTTFPGGIAVDGTTLNDILVDGAFYWQGDKPVLPANGTTEITGGDVFVSGACVHEGNWIDADCDTPKTCAACGEIEGEPLDHSWNAADCENPKTCNRCGETEGEALGHSWIAADCEDPKTCNRCGETEGEALGHSWIPADCENPKICSVCDTIEGKALGHNNGEDNICTVCGKDNNIITIKMMLDSDGGGDSSAILVYEDGVLVAEVVTGGSSSVVWTHKYDPDKSYYFFWKKGGFSEDCSFEILIAGKKVLVASNADCANYADNELLYPSCEHDIGENGQCLKCGKTFTCSVKIDDLVTYYDNVEVACAAACAADEATVTLYRLTYNSEWIFTSGNITLDLNGQMMQVVFVYGATLTVTDSAEQKGTIFNEHKTSIGYLGGKVIILDTTDPVGEIEEHEPWFISNDFRLEGVTIGTTGTEDIVLPADCVAISYRTDEEVNILPSDRDSVYIHRHSWNTIDCYTPRTCGTCGMTESEAPGHSYADDGICVICGKERVTIDIHMTDSFNDGWMDNAIEIYEDGVLVATATVEEGSSAVWTSDYDPEKEYEFFWVKGLFAKDCAFEIRIAGEVVVKAASADCAYYSNGQRIYPNCKHSYGAYWVCTGCGMTIPCTVEVSGTVTPYLNFEDAVNAACAAGTATLKLYADVPNDFYYFTSGAVTLDLNGKTVNGQIGVYGATLTVTDTAEQKGTMVNDVDRVIDYASGKLIILDTTDSCGAVDGHEPWTIVSWANTATIGTTGKEDIVLPADCLALGLNTGEEITVLPYVGYLCYIHSHRWNDATCTAPKTCAGCGKTEGEALVHQYTAAYSWDYEENTCTATGTCGFCGDVLTETVKFSSKVVGEAYCYMPGIVQCDAEFAAEWAEDQSVKYEDSIDPNRHGPDRSYQNNSDGTHNVLCDHCDVALEKNVDHRIEANITEQWVGNCVETGYIFYRCPDCGAAEYVYTGVRADIHAADTPSSPVDNGDGTHTMYYTCCNTPSDQIMEHTFEEGNCACGVNQCDVLGHKDADNSGRCDNCQILMQSAKPVMTVKGFSLSFEDEIQVNIYYSVADVTYIVEQGVLVFYSEPGTVDFGMADAVYNEPVANSAGAYYGVSTAGIAAKEMGDTRYYVAYAKLDDGTYVYSNICGYSPKQYAMNMLGKSTTSDKQKVLCVAMLNFGAAAQEYFGYKTDDLMNAELTDEQKALVIPYDKTLFTGAVEADASKVGAFAATASGFAEMGATVSLEGAFSVNYYITPSATVSGDLTLYIWTPEAYAAADILTAENASQTVSMTICGQGSYWGQVKNIAAKGLDDTYYVAGVYTDDSGNTYCTGVIAYSVSQYCLNKAVDGSEMQQLAGTIAMYGYYAKQYFTK